MKIEQRKLSEIKPYEKKPRVNDQAVDAVAKSIFEFGFRVPIILDSAGVIICGHTRWKAAKKLGLETVPVHVASELTPAQVKALRLADNKTGEIATWDLDILPAELQDLRELGIDLEMLGFESMELEKLLGAGISGNPGKCDPDEVPLPPDAAVTQKGDLWILGDHRLLCGDSSAPADLDRLLAGQKISLVNTDPPYNVKVEPRSNNAIAAGLSSFGGPTHHQSFDAERNPDAKPTNAKLRPKDRPLANDFVSDGEFDRLLRAWFGNIARVLEPGRGFYIWGGYANCANYPAAMKENGLYFSQAIIWIKGHPVLTRKDMMGNHEWCFHGWRDGAEHQCFLNEHDSCFYGWKEGAAHYFNPTIKNATDVWTVKKVAPQNMVHLTEKPAELAVRAMMYSSHPGERVLDLFGGSGSTLIGAEQCGRHARLIELDELYCDVIVTRWEKFTGKKAERAA